MSFDWRPQFTLANNLLAAPPSECEREAVYRTAVSRIYYACFCTARDLYMRKHHVTFPNEAVHAEVQKRYRQAGHAMGWKTYELVARNLQQLQAHRIAADYKPGMADPAAVAAVCQRIGRILLEQLAAIN